jgi:hypothetical protein
VVHIDLGIAFEQGKFLNTPELVPFRLTSNVVDGMGATGAAIPPAQHCDTLPALAPVSTGRLCKHAGGALLVSCMAGQAQSGA